VGGAAVIGASPAEQRDFRKVGLLLRYCVIARLNPKGDRPVGPRRAVRRSLITDFFNRFLTELRASLCFSLSLFLDFRRYFGRCREWRYQAFPVL
jgi:hypothetical protein